MKTYNGTNLKLNLGSGADCKQGYVNVDYYYNKADVKHNLNKYPYPFKTNSVEEVIISHTIRYVEDLIKFFKEMHRICKNKAIIKIIDAHYSNQQAFNDFLYKQHPLGTRSFLSIDSTKVREPMLKNLSFRMVKRKLIFKPSKNFMIRFITWLANRKTTFSERWVSKIIPFEEVYIEIQVIK